MLNRTLLLCCDTDSVTGEQVVYSYDSLNRRSSASAYTFSGTPSTNCTQTTGSTATWTESYALDGFGNLTNKIGTGGAPNVPIGVNPTNNQITDGAPQYDANGNLTAQTGVSYTYDAENRMTNFGSVNNGARTFAYDSQNKRILNWTGSTDQNGNASGYTVYYYGVKGERLGVYNFTVGYWAGGTTPTLENSTTSTETFFGARRLAPLDRLGSARSVNNTASSYYPFGEDKSTNPAIDAWKFGTYWRESASGLDYADQRFYSSTLGRFLTPDLFGGSEAGLNPQSWNRYSYSLNDPVNYFDPTGKNAVCVTKVDEGDDDSSTECFGGDGSSGSGSGSGGASPVQTFGAAPPTFTVTGYSRTGAKENTITNDLNDILDQVLTGGCAKWLTGQDFSASQFIAVIETGASGGPSYGYGALSINTLAAFVGTTNANGTPVAGLPAGSTITINTNGAFFNSAYTVGSGNTQYTGGTLQAQIFILVHELAHLAGAAGFLSDNGNQNNVNSNNVLVQKNCGKQIAGVQ